MALDGGVRVFDLAPGEGAYLALGLGVLSVVVGAALAALFGFGFVVLGAGAGRASFYTLAGAPRAIEVHGDRVVVRYAIRRDRTIPGAELILQRLPGELVLIHGNDTILLDGEVIADRSVLERCGEAIEGVARETIRRTQLGPRR